MPVDEGLTADRMTRSTETTHERVYQELRRQILTGEFLPGRPVTLRGLAAGLDVSPMPVREAVRQLIAARALVMHDNRRVSIPAMTVEKFDEILFARRTLEPELAARALPNFDKRTLQLLAAIDDDIDEAMRNGDVEAYMRGNYAFHFSIYRLANAPTILGLVESIWLQFGPFMRVVYGQFGTAKLEDQHQRALDAIRQNDEATLKLAISEDIMQGMRFIGEAALDKQHRDTTG